MNMKHMDVYLNYQVVVMSNLQKFKDQILKQNTPHKSMCLELVLVRDLLSQCKEWRCLSRDKHASLGRMLAQESYCIACHHGDKTSRSQADLHTRLLKKWQLKEQEWDWHNFDHKWPRKQEILLWALVHVLPLSAKVAVEWLKNVPEVSPKHKLCWDLNELEPHEMCICSPASWQSKYCSIKR